MPTDPSYSPPLHITGDRLRTSLWRVTAAWMFGSVWMLATSGAPITLFAKSLNASKFQFGVLSAMPFIASLVSLPASVLIERTGRRRAIFLWGLYFQRFVWIGLATLPVLLVHFYGLSARSWVVLVFLGMMFLMHAGQAMGGPAWTGWMADIVPKRIRGKYFSRRRAYGVLTGVPAALSAGWLLDRFTVIGTPVSTMVWCGGIFVVAAIFGAIDIAFFHFVPDVPTPPKKVSHVIAGLWRPLRDRQYLWFAGFVASMTFAVSFMGQFLTLYLLDRIGVTNAGTQLMLLVVPSLAQLFVFQVWGQMVDRMGKKPVLAIASLGLVPVGLGWCLMNSGLLWLGYVLSSLGAVLWAGVEIANSNMVLDLAGSKESDGAGGSSYVAVNSVIINLAGCAGGLASGAIAQWLNHWEWNVHRMGIDTITFYEVLFGISGLLRLLAAIVFLPKIHEPAARPTHEALRYMTANIYNNLFSAVLLPVRLVTQHFADEQE